MQENTGQQEPHCRMFYAFIIKICFTWTSNECELCFQYCCCSFNTFALILLKDVSKLYVRVFELLGF